MKSSLYVVKNRFFRFFIALFVVVVPPLLALYHWSNSPVSSQTISQNTAGQNGSFLQRFRPISTAYFSAEVPADWIRMNRGSRSNIELVVYAPTGQPGQLSIVSKPLPADGLSGVGDYNLRTHLTSQFSRVRDPRLSTDVTVFASTSDGYSYTAFMTRAARYASVNVSQLNNGDDTLQLLSHILNSWHWQ
jgi:hypothetical protein